MKIVQESIFLNSLRSFFGALFGTIGVVIGIVLFFVILIALLSLSDGSKFGSNVKIRPDAEGNRKELAKTAPILLEILIDGEIGGDSLTGEKIQDILLSSREDELKDRVKGILLTINSPGGGVNDSDVIYHLLKDYKERYHTPIYAYVDGLCASGGYYIACASDKIYSSGVSAIGSIGVLSWPPFVNVSQTLEKIGVNTLTLTAGNGKDEMNPFRPWKEGEQKHYQTLIDFYYGKFVEIVSTARPPLTKEVLASVGAQVFPAPHAKELGYVDEITTTGNKAIKDLAHAAGIKEGEKYQVITLQSKSWWKKVMSEKSPLFTGNVHHEVNLPQELRMEKGNPFSYLFKPSY